MAKPFLKWVGGKQKVCERLCQLLPPDADDLRHVEPFVGGGAFFFHRWESIDRALLCDVNRDLINVYINVAFRVEKVIEALAVMERAHDADHYRELRKDFNDATMIWGAGVRSAAFIYLNKTCFNGLWRVNKSGDFNVPMGSYKSPRILDAEALRDARVALSSSEIRHQPFELTLEQCGLGDFVYLDPPYDPVSKTSSFTSYAQGGFDQAAQVRLRDAFADAAERGAKLMLSNSDTPFIRELYRDYHLETIQVGRSINSDGAKRGKVSEVVVRSYRLAQDNDDAAEAA